MPQQLAWQVSVVLIVTLAIAFLFAISRSNPKTDYAPVQQQGYRLRTRFFWVLAATALPVMLLTLFRLPYAEAEMHPNGAITVDAVGHQWYWTLSADKATVGQPVVFRVTSADVNHGFGIYDANLRLVAQTQAMPGYINQLTYTFQQPGTYKVLCLEFCGTVHHNMVAEFHVVAPQQQ